jgi:hypothetical protein
MTYPRAMGAGALLIALILADRAPGGPTAAQADEATLQAAKIATDGPALLDFFRRCTLAEADRHKIQALIDKLGDESYDVREQASAELVRLGPVAGPLLRQAAKDPDIEVVRRAEKCLQKIEESAGPAVAAAAARLLAVRKPPEATAVLLAYLPFADGEVVGEEVHTALAALALPEGKPDATLLAALDDQAALRRGAAVQAFLRGGAAEKLPGLRRFLQDPEPIVRYQTAFAFLDAKDKESIPTLINLLADLPLERCWPVEDILTRLAGEQAPRLPLGNDTATRHKCRDAWKDWWTKHGDKIDLAKVDLAQRLLGYTLIVEMNRNQTGRVAELGADGKPIWQIEGLLYPVDAQVLANDRVLITEYRSRRVTERDFKGDVKWEKSLPAVVQGAQRLANGNTFIVARNLLVEVDHDGKEVAKIQRQGMDVMAARKLMDGQVLLVTTQGICLRLDANGKEQKSFPCGTTFFVGSDIDVLPNGHVVVPQTNHNKVVEFDAEGKVVWEAQVTNPTAVARLPNGNTLVTSMTNQRAVELDRAGKQVWEYKADGRLIKLRRR